MDTEKHNSSKIYTPEGGSKLTKESYLAKQEELRQKITIKDLEQWLSLTVKHDNQNKVISFYLCRENINDGLNFFRREESTTFEVITY
jgi:hypothetical protein